MERRFQPLIDVLENARKYGLTRSSCNFFNQCLKCKTGHFTESSIADILVADNFGIVVLSLVCHFSLRFHCRYALGSIRIRCECL